MAEWRLHHLGADMKDQVGSVAVDSVLCFPTPCDSE